MRPVKSDLIDNESPLVVVDGCHLKSFDESLLSPPALVLDKGIKNVVTESSSNRDDVLTSETYETLNQASCLPVENYPHERIDETLLSPPALSRHQRKQPEKKDVDLTTDESNPLENQGNSNRFIQSPGKSAIVRSRTTDTRAAAQKLHVAHPRSIFKASSNHTWCHANKSKFSPPVMEEPVMDENSNHLVKTSCHEKNHKQGIMSVIRNTISSTSVEVLNLSNGDGVEDTIVLSKSVLDALEDLEEKIPCAESRDDDAMAALASSSGIVHRKMCAPEVEVTTTTIRDADDSSDKIIHLPTSVVELMDGMEEDVSVLPDYDTSFSFASEVDRSVKSAVSTIISSVMSVAASATMNANGETSTTDQEQTHQSNETKSAEEEKPADASGLGSRMNRADQTQKSKQSATTTSPTLEHPRDTDKDATHVTIAAYVLKPTKSTKTGISISQTSSEKIKISEVTKGGLLDSSGVKVGDEVLSINDIKTEGLCLKDVATMIKGIEGSVTMLLRRKLTETKRQVSSQRVVHGKTGSPASRARKSILQKASKLILRSHKTKQESVDGACIVTGETSEKDAASKMTSNKKPKVYRSTTTSP